MKMEKVLDHIEDKGDLAVVQKGGKEKIYVPFAELIDKFHKIRAGKRKDRHNIVCDHYAADAHDELKKRDADVVVSTDSKRPSSARNGICERLKTEIGAARRKSLPSIFHPALNLSTRPDEEKDSSSDARERKQQSHVGVSCGLSRRRFSLPYVIKEYAKEDLDELERKLPSRAATAMHSAKKDSNVENERLKERGMNGKELHAFYNLWEKPRKPMRKSVVRRLEPILRDGDVSNKGEGRPRVFTF